jgi:hypothetical protein
LDVIGSNRSPEHCFDIITEQGSARYGRRLLELRCAVIGEPTEQAAFEVG